MLTARLTAWGLATLVGWLAQVSGQDQPVPPPATRCELDVPLPR